MALGAAASGVVLGAWPAACACARPRRPSPDPPPACRPCGASFGCLDAATRFQPTQRGPPRSRSLPPGSNPPAERRPVCAPARSRSTQSAPPPGAWRLVSIPACAAAARRVPPSSNGRLLSSSAVPVRLCPRPSGDTFPTLPFSCIPILGSCDRPLSRVSIPYFS